VNAVVVIALLALLVVPVLFIVRSVRSAVGAIRDWRSDRRLRAERAAARRPGPGTRVLEGRVRVPHDPRVQPRVVLRREFGCLGGPLVHDVSAFQLELPDGSFGWVEVGPDPVVENDGALPEVPATNDPGFGTGGPISGRLLTGRVRVAGVLPAAEGRFAPPPRRSAVLTILAPDEPAAGRRAVAGPAS
jgi:hypothetical protein